MSKLTETIMKSSQVSRIIISTSIVAVVGLLTYNWAVSPQASYLHAAQQYETVSLDVDKNIKIMLNNVKINEIKLKKLQARIKSSRSSFFSDGQAADFFGLFEKISTAAGCNLESMIFANETITSLDKKEQSPKIIEKKANVKVTGSYGAIIALTSVLKDYPLTVYINDLRIKSIDLSADNLACSMDIKIYLTENRELLIDE